MFTLDFCKVGLHAGLYAITKFLIAITITIILKIMIAIIFLRSTIIFLKIGRDHDRDQFCDHFFFANKSLGFYTRLSEVNRVIQWNLDIPPCSGQGNFWRYIEAGGKSRLYM